MVGSAKAPIWRHFHELSGTNSKHKRACCRACVKNTLRHPPAEWNEAQPPPTGLSQDEKKARFDRACQHVGTIGGVASSMAAHNILGYPGHPACPHASEEATDDAKESKGKARTKNNAVDPTPTTGTRSRDGVNDPVNIAASEPSRPAKKQRNGAFYIISAKDSQYETAEAAAVRKQACRAIVSSGVPFAVFEDVEMQKLFDMVRSGTSDILPSGNITSRFSMDEKLACHRMAGRARNKTQSTAFAAMLISKRIRSN
ncbi:hypothetical protein DFH07DRAFT_381388 [Mycena maculata]|uniref:Uncharacterized protein n=1 Tax=Mycena maculata TaxID=230809 RepID=A0AAD7MFC2_9AGAR|nr:hypothetical protein DFH07DRAFT_381388 [Mycena maculata]